ncbi:MAG: amidohydrolase family protein, partial [Rudaea sp.]
MRLVPLAAAVAALFAMPAIAQSPAAPVTVVQCGHLIDVEHGKMLGASTIVVEADRVKEVLDGTQQRAGANTISMPNATCMPGLIDSHTHLTMQFSKSTY